MDNSSIAQIVNTVGPIDKDWGFEQTYSIADVNKVSVEVTVWVRKKLFVPGGGNGKVEISQWGYAEKQTSHDPEGQAEINAIKNCLIWLGILRDENDTTGIASLIEVLGPLGINWGFEIADLEHSNGDCRVQVKTWIRDDIINAQPNLRKRNIGITSSGKAPEKDDEDIPKPRRRRRKILKRTDWGSAPLLNPLHEMQAAVNAIKKSLTWLGIVEGTQPEPTSQFEAQTSDNPSTSGQLVQEETSRFPSLFSKPQRYAFIGAAILVAFLICF